MKRRVRLIFCAVLSFAATSVVAQAPCRVLDPELAGAYAGGCKDGLANGYGEASGSAEYKGEFRAGRKHGKGTKVWASGDRYEGNFADDMKHGTGRYVWGSGVRSSGERYAGEYRNDMREGIGTYEWPSGDRYEGAWRRDLPIGPLTKMMMARIVAERAAMQAVGIPGSRICREVTFGIANRDVIRGEIIKVDDPFVVVRIIDPGLQVHLVNRISYDRGVVVRSTPLEWEPCK